jgi:hypothetical protein
MLTMYPLLFSVVGLPMDNYLSSVDYVEESTHDSVVPKGAKGYADLGLKPSKVSKRLLGLVLQVTWPLQNLAPF